MLDSRNLHIAFLLQAGYTHLELKKILLTGNISPEILWKKMQDNTISLDISDDRKARIQEKYKKVDPEKIQKYVEEKNIDIIAITDPEYPESLKAIWHAPAFLYVRGTLRSDIPLIGVVGSRKHTPYAERILKKILPDIIGANVWIISGGATWVDTMAHEITLADSGYTVAVFGTGIDRCYPAGNKKLFESIIESWGALISHFPLGTGPELYNFPMRNEIVAALSRGIIIPEAGLSSGTLITAQLALEHGRDVFAVPGDIDRTTSEGTNMLISTWQAKIVRCAGDILEEYFDLTSLGNGMTPIVKSPPIFSNDTEKSIYEAIEWSNTSIDILLTKTWLEMTELLTNIAMLEIAGHITLDEMGRYQIL